MHDVFLNDGRLWLRLQENGGKILQDPCHLNFESWLTEYVAETAVHTGQDGLLLRVLERDDSLSGRRLNRHKAWEMICRRARAAGITTDVCNHGFRATGITAYLENPEA